MTPFRRLYTAVRVVAFAAVVWLVNAPANADELITLKTRPGVTQPILLWQPSPADPQVVLLLFPGAGGNVGFERKGDRIEAKGTYLLSHHRDLLLRPEVVVAVIDAPSDQPDMDSEFRRSAKHFEDMTAVARELKDRYRKTRLVLLGHSRGTVSAAYVAQALGDRVAAVILMAGFYERNPWRGVGLSEFDFDALRIPALIVHHVKDMCPSTLFGPAQKLSERLPAIIVDGPDEAKSDQPCVPGTNHWFDGKEKETLDQVLNWMRGKAWVRLIR
ncbi:MAG: alpha/beta hydrolase [Gammaproteobacteria bacterium]